MMFMVSYTYHPPILLSFVTDNDGHVIPYPIYILRPLFYLTSFAYCM